MLKQEFMDVVVDARSLLQQEQAEWSGHWAGYAQAITGNQGFIRSVRGSFREWKPLRVYLNTAQAKNAKKSVKFDLRYLGQTIAVLTVKEGERKLSTKVKNNEIYLYETNMRDFGCDLRLDDVDWDSKEGSAFRTFFRDRQGPRNDAGKAKNEEHRLEELWITELLDKDNKKLPNVQAVKIGNVRFAMKTPLSASKPKELKYSGVKGGGIDILARGGIGANTSLCILELKAENNKPQASVDALKQAVAYATFIRELLRSESGAMWWRLFGFTREVPQNLVLHAACVLPSGHHNLAFEDLDLEIDDDRIKLHYVYFTEENNQIRDVTTSLKW